ncbi:uncharacterized protein LOC135150187 [Daucus carota subsp. sativus]|uniref:uncharacterized protein LOC135150187 n=1 Tax=Daucus carota subsp. sativus TaxID=79200 RepID=UPI0030830AFA
MTPVLRPRGIGLKYNLLFSTLKARTERKAAGVPDCEGAATTKAPWNTPELFDLSALEGETIRVWEDGTKRIGRRSFSILRACVLPLHKWNGTVSYYQIWHWRNNFIRQGKSLVKPFTRFLFFSSSTIGSCISFI